MKKKNGLIKKCGSIILLSLLLTLMYGLVSLAYKDTIGTVGERGAIIRAEASTSSESLASVPGGKNVTICGEKTGDDTYTWYLVYVTGTQTGYIRGDLITNTGTEVGTITPDTATSGTTTNQEDPNDPIADEIVDTDGEETEPEENQEVVTSSDCTLATLSISQGTMEPEFSPSITQYTITVAEDVSAIAAFGVANDVNASVIESTGFSDLQLGSNNAVVTVQGLDKTTLSYNFTVIRGSVEAVIDTPVENEDTSTDIITNPDETVEDTEVENQDAEKDTNSFSKSQKIFILLMGIVIIVLILIITFMAIQLRDLKASLVWDDGTDRDNDNDTDNDTYQEEIEDSEPFFVPKKLEKTEHIVRRSKIETLQEEETLGDLDLEDELEDIREREATDEKEEGNKDTWKSVNFLTPEDDLEFDFLDLDDEE